jgi:hypothetical protein
MAKNFRKTRYRGPWNTSLWTQITGATHNLIGWLHGTGGCVIWRQGRGTCTAIASPGWARQ